MFIDFTFFYNILKFKSAEKPETDQNLVVLVAKS